MCSFFFFLKSPFTFWLTLVQCNQLRGTSILIGTWNFRAFQKANSEQFLVSLHSGSKDERMWRHKTFPIFTAVAPHGGKPCEYKIIDICIILYMTAYLRNSGWYLEGLFNIYDLLATTRQTGRKERNLLRRTILYYRYLHDFLWRFIYF